MSERRWGGDDTLTGGRGRSCRPACAAATLPPSTRLAGCATDLPVRSQSDRSPIASDLLKALFNRGRLEVTPHSANGLLTPPYSLRRDGLARWLARDLTSGPPMPASTATSSSRVWPEVQEAISDFRGCVFKGYPLPLTMRERSSLWRARQAVRWIWSSRPFVCHHSLARGWHSV